MELFERIRTEPDLYYAYQANIAMAFKDEFPRQAFTYFKDEESGNTYLVNDEKIHDIANQAAKNFLNLLIKPIEKDENTSTGTSICSSVV